MATTTTTTAPTVSEVDVEATRTRITRTRRTRLCPRPAPTDHTPHCRLMMPQQLNQHTTHKQQQQQHAQHTMRENNSRANPQLTLTRKLTPTHKTTLIPTLTPVLLRTPSPRSTAQQAQHHRPSPPPTPRTACPASTPSRRSAST